MDHSIHHHPRGVMKAMAKIALAMFLAFILLSCRFSGAKGIRSNLPVKTIKTTAGDVFVCVDLYKQPAFDHPLLKDHQILMKPAGRVAFNDFARGVPKANNDTLNVEVVDGGCPVGTVPVHRLPNTNLTGDHRVLDGRNDVVRMWATREAIRRNYFGASSRIYAYGVHPLGPGQESAAMIGLKNMDSPPESRGEIQAGWKAAPAIFGDYVTRFFIQWSANGMQTSCVNLLCPGFVQTNHKVYLGSRVLPLSTYKGPQYYIYLHMYKDEKNNWWVAIDDVDNVIGYWPNELFQNFGYATMPYFGGLVSCKQGEVCPPMGNGHMPSRLQLPGPDNACFMGRVQVIGPDFNWGGLGRRRQNAYLTNYRCHGLGAYERDVHAYKFSFGGEPCLV